MVTKQHLYTINYHFIYFLYAAIIHKPVSFQFQNVYTRVRLTNNANQQYNQISSLFSLYCISTTLNKPKYRYNLSRDNYFYLIQTILRERNPGMLVTELSSWQPCQE